MGALRVDEMQERFEQYPSLQDPHPFLAELRETAPVFRARDFWFVTSYEHVLALIQDPKRWRSDHMQHSTVEPDPYYHDPKKGLFSRVKATHINVRDGDDHRRLRSLVSPMFTPRAIEAYLGAARVAVEVQLEQATASPEFDFIRDFALPIPTRIILDILGLPQSEAYRFYEMTDVQIPPPERGTPEEWFVHADEVYGRHRDYLLEEVALRRTKKTGDLLDHIVTAGEERGDPLDDVELMGMIAFLVIAGFETTANTLANGVYWLLRNPDQFALLQEDRSLIPRAVDEILRYDPAARNAGVRFPVEDTVFGGQLIRRGERVVPSILGPNRDPAVFSDPDEFDIRRDPNPYITFGRGPHVCLGNSLASLEIRVALEIVLDGLPGLRLAGDPDWRTSFIIRGLESMPVRWGD